MLASDGLWDVMRNDDVARFVMSSANRSFLDCVRDLCNEAMVLGSTDNVTALVIDLRLVCQLITS